MLANCSISIQGDTCKSHSNVIAVGVLPGNLTVRRHTNLRSVKLWTGQLVD